jgi:hypothetical protein
MKCLRKIRSVEQFVLWAVAIKTVAGLDYLERKFNNKKGVKS